MLLHTAVVKKTSAEEKSCGVGDLTSANDERQHGRLRIYIGKVAFKGNGLKVQKRGLCAFFF